MELVKTGFLKPGRSLDVGCGTGTNATYLARNGFEAHGLDISKVAIRKAIAKARDLGVRCDFRVMDFLNIEAISKLPITFDVILDLGCFHSLSNQERLKYRESLGYVSKRGTIYLLWCFLRGSRWSFGPPGVDEDEAEKILSRQFQLIEKRRLDTEFREMLFYIMRREQ